MTRGKLPLLLASSRTLQAHLSIAQPALGALLAAGRIPPGRTIGLGFVASWTGLHAVFGLNDLLDVELDRRRFDHQKGFAGFDIDAAIARHPLARGALRKRDLLAWVGVNAGVAIPCASLLHPLTVVVFLAAAGLEVVYCRLAKRTPLKFLVTGVMVALGASAGWFAVTRRLDATLAAFVAWMAAWEIGGRNIVNDWSDAEEDRHLGIRTVPVVYAERVTARLIFAFIAAAAVLGIVVALVAGLGATAIAGTAVAGAIFLVSPALRLVRGRSESAAHALFNRASLYPPATLAAIGLDLLVRNRF